MFEHHFMTYADKVNAVATRSERSASKSTSHNPSSKYFLNRRLTVLIKMMMKRKIPSFYNKLNQTDQAMGSHTLLLHST